MYFWRGENNQLTQCLTIGFLQADGTEGGIHCGDKRFYENMFDQPPRRWESRNALAGTRFAIHIRRCCEVWALNSKSCRSCCGIQRCDPHWMSTPRRLRPPNMQRRQPCSHWCSRLKPGELRSWRHLPTLQRDKTLPLGGPAKRDTIKGTKTCPFGSSMACAKLEQSFWNEWRGRRDSNSRPLP
jgi:hypothetical protein